MKIGVIIDHREGTLEQSIRKLNDYDFDNYQLSSWEPKLWTQEQADIILKCEKEYGVTMSAFWCGWSGPKVWDFYEGHILGLVPEQYREQRINDLKRGSDFARLFNATQIVTHVGFIPENPNDENYKSLIISLRELANHCKSNGQDFMFETGQETPVTLLRTIEDIGTGNLGINFDTANLIMYGKANPLDALDVFGKHIKAMHAKDGMYPKNGRELGNEVKIGTGKVDFKNIIRRLKDEFNFTGPITIEREIDGEQQINDIIESRKYLEQFTVSKT